MGDGGRGVQSEVVGILSRKVFMLINSKMKGCVCLNSVSSQCARGKSSLA